MVGRHSREVSRIVIRTVYYATAHSSQRVLQIVREGYLLLCHCLGVVCTLLQSVVAVFVCRTKVVQIELRAAAHATLVTFWIFKDVALHIVKVLACVERGRREEDGLRVLPLCLCLSLKLRLHFVSVVAQCLHILSVYLAKHREGHIVARSEVVHIPWHHSACGVCNVTLGCARMARLVFFAYALCLLGTLDVKLLAKTLLLLIVLVYLLQSEEAVVLVAVRHHVVLHTACRLRTLLVLHDAVALVVYHSVPLLLQQLLVQAKVGECGYHHALAALRRSRRTTFLSPTVKVTNLHVQVVAVLNPVAHLCLARGYNKYTSLALLHKSLRYAKSRKSLARTRAIGKHIALAISMLSVRVFTAEELCLRS